MMRILGGTWVAALVFSLAGTASAENPDDPPEPAWIPSLSAGVEIFDWASEESVQNLVNGPFLEVHGDDDILIYTMMLGGELAGPPLQAVPGSPRIVLGGGAGFVLPVADQLVDEGEVSSVVNPERDIAAYESLLDISIGRNCLLVTETKLENCPRLDVLDVGGQGSDIRMSFDTVTWHAKIGASFEVPVASDAAIQIRPSIAYRGERVKLQSRLTTVTLDQFVLPPDATPPDPQLPAIVETTIHRSRPGAKNAVHHHLGPSLELGVVTSRSARPIRTTVYFHASYLWLVSDPVEEFADSGGVARFRVRRESSAFRGGIGVRFSWLGLRAR